MIRRLLINAESVFKRVKSGMGREWGCGCGSVCVQKKVGGGCGGGGGGSGGGRSQSGYGIMLSVLKPQEFEITFDDLHCIYINIYQCEEMQK